MLSLDADGTDRKVIVHECRLPDGIAVDVEAGHIYWTNMGKVSVDDGSIERVELDGLNGQTIVPAGGTFTPSSSSWIRRTASSTGPTARGCG